MASRTAGAGTTSDSCLEPPSSTAASPDWSRHDRGRKRRPEMSIRRGTPVARRARMARALAVAMAAAVLGVSGARAQAPADQYAEKPIEIIVPFAPGRTVAMLARGTW